MKDRSVATSQSEERAIRVEALFSWWPYTAGSLQRSIEQLIEEVRGGEWSADHERQFFVYAEASWPARVAARRFADEQQEVVWQEVLDRCLPTTQLLLERLSEQEGHTRYADILRSGGADFALFEGEHRELALLLPQVYAILWKTRGQEMVSLVNEAAQELEDAKRHTLADAASRASFEQALIFGEDFAR